MTAPAPHVDLTKRIECLIEYPHDPLPRQGINSETRNWHSSAPTASFEFSELGWSIGDSNPGPLACQACAAKFSFGILRLESTRMSTSSTAVCRSNCGPDCGPAHETPPPLAVATMVSRTDPRSSMLSDALPTTEHLLEGLTAS
jgi:hypothetical protein